MIEPVYASFGRMVRRARRRRGWSQERLAARLDPPHSRTSIAGIEAGRTRAPLHVAMQLLEELGLTMGDGGGWRGRALEAERRLERIRRLAG